MEQDSVCEYKYTFTIKLLLFIYFIYSCTSFHYVAIQCLNALKLRARYEVLPLSMQVPPSL